MTRRGPAPPVTATATASLPCSAVARELGVAANTVRHWCREGWLRAHVEVSAGGYYRIPRRVFEQLLAGEIGPPEASPRASKRAARTPRGK